MERTCHELNRLGGPGEQQLRNLWANVRARHYPLGSSRLALPLNRNRGILTVLGRTIGRAVGCGCSWHTAAEEGKNPCRFIFRAEIYALSFSKTAGQPFLLE
jgi:hypothetical protein